MSSSYNTPCSKYKLVVSIYSNTETSLAMSTLAVWCCVLRSRDFSPPLSKPTFSENLILHLSLFLSAGLISWL